MRAVSRRQVLALSAGAVLAGGAAAEPSLDALARARGLRFGTALGARSAGDDAYHRLVARECGIIVPENELKLYAIRPGPTGLSFEGADRLAAFARDNRLLFRGHTLIWDKDEFAPKWLLEQGLGPNPERWLADYVRAVAGRYAGRVQSWDVVNESIDPATGELRDTVFRRALGPEALDIAFRAAREADPGAKLAYNDYMGWGDGDAKHRAGVLRLLERLKARGVPLDALGVQGHIGFSQPADDKPPSRSEIADWRRFLEEAAGLGLDLLVTELDVNDKRLPADTAGRDATVAAHAREFLDVTLSVPQVKQVLCWGFADRYSWLQRTSARPDGLPKRPTPYDDAYHAKPMRAAIAAALRAAPERTPWT